MKLLVLLSTYNGNKFLREQLESILNQDEVEITILIRDDGSSDDTVGIIKSYQSNHSNIKLIEGRNLGSAHSFIELIKEAYYNYQEYDYYSFCDQDDKWLPQKLNIAVKKIENELDSDKPCLYLGSYQMVDSKLNYITTTIYQPLLNLESAFVSNPATGCTMVFNRNLLDIVAAKQTDYIIMHDYWVYLVCLVVGGCVCYDPTPYILYRQHDHNVIGGINDSFMKRWVTRFKKVFKKGDNFKSKTAKQLLQCYGSKIKQRDRIFLEQVSTCNRLSSRINLLKNRNFKGHSFDKNLQLLGLIVTGKL